MAVASRSSVHCSIIASIALVFASPSIVVNIAAAEMRELCNGIKIDSPKAVSFNANEKKLICGDPDAGSWEDIPDFEAEYFIQTFLQDRGYFFPTFRREDDAIIVDPGAQTYIERIEVVGSPPAFFDVTRRRKIKGQVLTPAILTTLEDWTKTQLTVHGYPCPKITALADATTGIVSLNVDPGPHQNIVKVIEEPVEGLRPGTFERYRAFNIGDPYNAQNLTLTSRRIEKGDGIVQSSYFLTECADDGAVLTQKSMIGPKRLLRIGVGASTEDFIIGRLQIRWARMGMNGSSIQLTARGSYRTQWLDARAFIYPLPHPSHWHLNPIVSTRRRDEKQFEYASVDVMAPAAVTWDTQNTGYRLRFGPGYNFTRTFKGAAHGDTHFVSLSARLNINSHDYDYFIADPQQGYYATIGVDLTSDKVLSSVTAQKLWIRGQALWNIAHYDPPFVIVALRGLAGVTITDRGAPNFPRLPPHFFYYLGGSTTVRGFSRFQLPSANRGALTALYAGAEVRLTNVLPLNFQPLVFFDMAALGQRSLDLDFPVYWSPGFGVRWPSLIGVFRFTLGHGFLINNNDPSKEGLKHWQFFFSFGEEF